MKKFLIIILSIFTIFFISYNYSNAVSVSDFSPILDKNVAKLKTTEEQIQYLKSFADSLTAPKYTKSKDAKLYNDIREYTLNMLKHFESELQKKQSSKSNTTTKQISKSDLPHLSDNSLNINEQKVRDAILSWHNEERKNVWVYSYRYNLDLEWSATYRANNLASSHKTSNLHARNSGDWYYNYNSMLNRFSNLWIKFPSSVKGAASFSETVWRNTYKCSKSDCTQELITAIKKTWTNLIMKEKTSNGSHYRAAVMKHFSQMGIWIDIDKTKNRYYLVIHYWVEF